MDSICTHQLLLHAVIPWTVPDRVVIRSQISHASPGHRPEKARGWHQEPLRCTTPTSSAVSRVQPSVLMPVPNMRSNSPSLAGGAHLFLVTCSTPAADLASSNLQLNLNGTESTESFRHTCTLLLEKSLTLLGTTVAGERDCAQPATSAAAHGAADIRF